MAANNVIEEINRMGHYTLHRKWLYPQEDDRKYLTGEALEAFKQRLFVHFGGFRDIFLRELYWN